MFGASRLAVLAPLSVASLIQLAGRSEASAIALTAAIHPSTRSALVMNAALDVSLLTCDSAIILSSMAHALPYNAREVRMVLGLPL